MNPGSDLEATFSSSFEQQQFGRYCCYDSNYSDDGMFEGETKSDERQKMVEYQLYFQKH